jgi:hypothetical protein
MEVVPGPRGGDAGSCGRRIPSQLGESEVVIAQGGLSKYCLHASDVRSLEGTHGGTSSSRNRDPRRVSKTPS